MTPEPHAMTLCAAIDALRGGTLTCTALTQSLLDQTRPTWCEQRLPFRGLV